MVVVPCVLAAPRDHDSCPTRDLPLDGLLPVIVVKYATKYILSNSPFRDLYRISKDPGRRHVMNYWAPFLHFYQPPIQESFVLREINETCYEPLFNMLLENPGFKMTFNVNSVLLDLLQDHGLEHTIDLLKELVDRKQVEVVGTAKFHPILPLIPRVEVERQISLQEKDLGETLPGWEKHGFFPPEMAVSPGLCGLVHRLGYEWLIASGIACSGEWPYDTIYQSPEGLLLYFRDDIISNEISFQKISVDFLLDKLQVLYDTDHYIITAQDGETFGHHVPGYERSFLKPALEGAIAEEDLALCWISELKDHFKVDGRIRVVPSSWSTTQADLDYNAPYPLWNHPDNQVHRVQFKLLKNVFELMYLVEEEPGLMESDEGKAARHFLDRGLHSCQFWWASARPMWSPNMIQKGAELLLKSAFNARLAIIDGVTTRFAVAQSEEFFDQVTQYYSLLLMEIMQMEQVIVGRRNDNYDEFFEELFTNNGKRKKEQEIE